MLAIARVCDMTEPAAAPSESTVTTGAAPAEASASRRITIGLVVGVLWFAGLSALLALLVSLPMIIGAGIGLGQIVLYGSAIFTFALVGGALVGVMFVVPMVWRYRERLAAFPVGRRAAAVGGLGAAGTIPLIVTQYLIIQDILMLVLGLGACLLVAGAIGAIIGYRAAGRTKPLTL
jgi:hypothetical protein